MRVTLVRSTLALLALLPLHAASAQITTIGRVMQIPLELKFKAVGDIPAETTPLMWMCGPATVETTLAVGTPIVREATVGKKKVTYNSTITEADRVAVATPVRVPATLGEIRGTIYVDKENPARLRVNPYLWPSVPEGVACDGAPAAVANGHTPTLGEKLRDVELYYELKNRQTVSLPTTGLALGAVTVPVRLRRAYTAGNGKPVDGGAVGDFNAGVVVGRSWGRSRYQYVRNADNAITETTRFTLGAFTTLSKATVDSATSRSAATLVTRPVSFATMSVGATAMVNVRGVDIGLFVGPEFALGAGDAQKWDYNRKLWYGIGFGYQAPK